MKIARLLTTGVCALAVVVTFTAAPTVSAEQEGAKVGTLTCTPIKGTKVNLLIHSSVQINCTFEGDAGTENYKGESGIGLGIDLSWKESEIVKWFVLAPSSDISPTGHALAGKYFGAKAEATVGVGAQANVLIGGGNKSFTLQPLSLGGQTGFGVAGGLGYMYLEAAK